MKRIILTLALGTALSSAAFPQSVGEKTGVDSALGIAPKTEDFVKEAAMSDMLEIEWAKIAQQKGNAEDKKFAAMMVTDHTKTSTELKEMVPADLKPVSPTALDNTCLKKLGKLRDAKPDDFAGNAIPCPSAPTRTPYPCSNAMPMAATTRN